MKPRHSSFYRERFRKVSTDVPLLQAEAAARHRSPEGLPMSDSALSRYTDSLTSAKGSTSESPSSCYTQTANVTSRCFDECIVEGGRDAT